MIWLLSRRYMIWCTVLFTVLIVISYQCSGMEWIRLNMHVFQSSMRRWCVFVDRKRKIFKSAAECLCKREKRGNEREKGSKTIVCCLWFDGWGAILKIQNSNCQLFSFFKLTNCLFSFFCDPRSHHMNSKTRLRWTCIILIPKTKEQDYSQLSLHAANNCTLSQDIDRSSK